MHARPFLELTGIFLLVALAIVAYGTYRCKVTSYKDPLTNRLADGPWQEAVDGWTMTHVVFYGVLAYLYPHWSTLAFIAVAGVLWEVIESQFKDRPFYLSSCKYDMNTDQSSGWWYGKYSDLVANTLGMVAGVAARKYMG